MWNDAEYKRNLILNSSDCLLSIGKNIFTRTNCLGSTWVAIFLSTVKVWQWRKYLRSWALPGFFMKAWGLIRTDAPWMYVLNFKHKMVFEIFPKVHNVSGLAHCLPRYLCSGNKQDSNHLTHKVKLDEEHHHHLVYRNICVQPLDLCIYYHRFCHTLHRKKYNLSVKRYESQHWCW